jgi:hypothetical protein
MSNGVQGDLILLGMDASKRLDHVDGLVFA